MDTNINVSGLWLVHQTYFVSISACVVMTIFVMGTPTIVLPQDQLVTTEDQSLQKESIEDLTTVVETTSSDTKGLQDSRLSVQEPRFFWGPDDKPLPPMTDKEIMAFMRTATIVSIEEIGEGVTNPWKVLLEKDGIRMNTIFRYVSKIIKIEGYLQEMRDDYIFECAAYEMGKMLGLNNIPPVVPRTIKGIDGKMYKGSIQIWIEHAITEKKRHKKKIVPFDGGRWTQDCQMVEVFDNLIYNDDRNIGNVLYDQTFTTWMIDHTRAFRHYSDLSVTHPKYLKLCERSVWEKLQTLEDIAIRQQLKPYLEAYEIDALLKRRQKLVAYIQGLIDENGETTVLFDW